MLTESTARARLQSMVAWDQEPTLALEELEDLVRIARLDLVYWAAAAEAVIGLRAIPTTSNGHVYEVTNVAGDTKTGAHEPAWPTGAGAPIVDGNVTWREVGAEPASGRWDLRGAAAEGWRRKAGKAAGNYKFTAGGSQLSRDQIFEHCLRMADRYAAKRVRSIPVGTTEL